MSFEEVILAIDYLDKEEKELIESYTSTTREI